MVMGGVVTTANELAGFPLDKVRKQRATQPDLGRVLLTLAMCVPFILGWLLGKTISVVWALCSWVWAAAVVGYQAARSTDQTKARGG